MLYTRGKETWITGTIMTATIASVSTPQHMRRIQDFASQVPPLKSSTSQQPVEQSTSRHHHSSQHTSTKMNTVNLTCKMIQCFVFEDTQGGVYHTILESAIRTQLLI